MKRWAKSYTIVDHELLHGGYLQRLSHQALALYLFYAVVGDSSGKSFYAADTVTKILRLDSREFFSAKRELVASGLIECDQRNTWLKNLSGNADERPPERDANKGANRKDPLPARRSRTELSADRKGTWHLAREVLETICRAESDCANEEKPT